MFLINKKYFPGILALFCVFGFLSIHSAEARRDVQQTESSKHPRMRVEGSKVPYSITYDSSKWTLLDREFDNIEYYFEGKDGAINAFIVPENSSFSMEEMPHFLLTAATLKGVDHASIVDEKIIKVCGRDIHYFELTGKNRRTREGIVFLFYTYSDSEITIQFGAWTTVANPEAVKGDMLELLEGLSFHN
ncbi:hypothetical protein [Estrella lausannensis]|uniref:DUF1795 domain-containing protein n=1 Tax=Estrella lausannensis TaxID=483423 RepID=A0A0H5DPM0_9BACT|nr:hypothetical protein [Estrella lausannensis]CRX37429.1 hypothetical protein ELAC_0066 [Estrella lausannensis]